MGFLACGFGVCEKPTPGKKLTAGYSWNLRFSPLWKGKSSCKTACLGFHVNFQGCTLLVANGWRSPKSCSQRCVLFVRWDRFPFGSVINILKGNTFWKRCFVQGGGSWVYAWDEWWFTGDDWWKMNEWMIETSEEPLVSFCISFRMSHGSLTIPGFICLRSISTPWTSRGASEGNIRSNQPCYHGRCTWKSWCSLRFPITHLVPTPAPIQKDLPRYLWFIYQSVCAFIHLYVNIYHNTYPFSNNHASEKMTLKETHFFLQNFPLPWLWGEE